MSKGRSQAPKGRMRHLLPLFRGSWWLFAWAVVATLLTNFFNAMTPQLIRMTVDSVIGDEPFALPAPVAQWMVRVDARRFLGEHLYWMALAVLVVALLSGLFNYSCRVAVAKGAEGFIRRLRDRLFGHIQRLPFCWHVQNKTGDIIQRCTSDVEVVRNFVSNQMLSVCRTVFLLFFALTMMYSMNTTMALAATAFIPAAMLYSGYFYRQIGKRFRVADEAEGVLSAMVQENLTGVRVVRAFGREQYEIERFDEKNNDFSQRWIHLGYLLGSYWGVGDLFTGLQVMTIILLGTVQAVSGAITVGEFIAFVSYNSTLTWPIRALGRILSDMSKAGVSLDRLNYILDAPVESDPPGALCPPMDREIAFSHVTFGYESGQPVLQDVSFSIPAGSTFAILGGTGSGKSTLMHLLDRLYDLPPEGGQITIGGVDIREISRPYLRRNIGMVLQEPYLFSRTLRENIAAASQQAPLEEVRRAAAVACIDESIQQFAQGYDTMVGERGVTLSGGQRQRVAIARMLMQQAPVMVFDDSLSAVDAQTDHAIRMALRQRMAGCTVILISHRITTLMAADRILVLEDGKVAQLGTHEELIAREGIYKTIYEIQMSSDDRALAMGGAGDDGQ